MQQEELGRALSAALSDPLDGEVCIEGLTRLSGGASRETWAFDAIGPDGARHALILRKDFEGAASQGLNLLLDKSERFDRAGEYAACVVLHDAGVPTPRPVCLPDPSTGLKGCFIMERLDGEALPKKLLHDDAYSDVRPTIAATLGAVAARIHGLGPDALPMLPTQDAPRQLHLIRSMLDLGGQTRPILELSL